MEPEQLYMNTPQSSLWLSLPPSAVESMHREPGLPVAGSTALRLRSDPGG